MVEKLIFDDHGNILDSFKISLESFMSFSGPLFRKPVTGHDFFLLFLTANQLYQFGYIVQRKLEPLKNAVMKKISLPFIGS